MGAWGTGFLENDVAADVNATFEDVLDAGGSVADAVEAVMDEWRDALDDMDDGPAIVLALAWLTSARGEVPAEIKTRALQVIREDQVRDRWREPADFAARQAENRRLIEILEGRMQHPERDG